MLTLHSSNKEYNVVEYLDITSFINSVTYSNLANKIYFKHDTTVIADIDTSDFVKSGMINDVVVSNGKLIISFNTDSGQENVEIELSDIFDADNYYSKQEINSKLDEKQNILVSGIDIKTINTQSVLGGGDIELLESLTFDNTPTYNSLNPVTSSGIRNAIDQKYSKPNTGIPEQDLADSIQTLLLKSSTAIQLETDPTVPSHVKSITTDDITNWNNKTSNTGTITGINMNGSSKGTSGVIDLGTVITSETQLSKGTTSGNGNAVTDITVSGHEITLTKSKTFLESFTETDPVYSASAAAEITSTDITNWNNKLSSFTETDPIYSASAAAGITTLDISNWNSKTNNVGTITGITMNNTSKGTSGVVDLGTVVTSETDPIYSASVAAGITASDISNWNSKTDNVGTITGINMNGSSKGTSGVVDLGTVVTQETDPIFTASPAASITSSDITKWNNNDTNNKYDKTGGNISGDVDIDGDLTLNIDDPDYNVGIKLNSSLNNNLGTILTINGYVDNTLYKTILRNVATPNSNYDAANKKYVDDHILLPTYYLVELNLDGSVKLYSSTLNYDTISANLTDRSKADYLDVIWESSLTSGEYTRFYAPCVGINEVNNGNLFFSAVIYHNGVQITCLFSLDNLNTLTTIGTVPTPEIVSNKVLSVVTNPNQNTYPSTLAIFNEFLRKPVIIWEANGTGLTALETDLSNNINWQLTNLDFSPYRRVKVYTKAAQKSGTTASSSTTPSFIIEILLDSRALGPYNAYISSNVALKPNDRNRLCTIACAISSDKTSFAVMRMTNLYGTAATDNSDVGGYVFLIEGYYD